jgi:hypothetical protein
MTTTEKKLKRYGKLKYRLRHAQYVIRYEQKDKKNTHTKNTYKNTHTNTEVSRKAYGIKAGQEYQVPALPNYYVHTVHELE